MRSTGQVSTKDKMTTSLERALAILELASQKRGGLTNADIHRKLGVPTSSCSYVLRRLEDAGFLRRSPIDRRYAIGIGILTLAHALLRELGLRVIAEPILHDLTRKTGFSGFVNVLIDGEAVIIVKVEQADTLHIDYDIGVSTPAHANAAGKMLLASLPQGELLSVLGSCVLHKLTKRTIDSKARLLQDLKLTRERGYSLCDEEARIGMRSMAAPIYDEHSSVCAALGLAGTRLQLDNPTTIRQLKAAASQISRRLAKSSLGVPLIEADVSNPSN